MSDLRGFRGVVLGALVGLVFWGVIIGLVVWGAPWPAPPGLPGPSWDGSRWSVGGGVCPAGAICDTRTGVALDLTGTADTMCCQGGECWRSPVSGYCRACDAPSGAGVPCVGPPVVSVPTSEVLEP